MCDQLIGACVRCVPPRWQSRGHAGNLATLANRVAFDDVDQNKYILFRIIYLHVDSKGGFDLSVYLRS